MVSEQENNPKYKSLSYRDELALLKECDNDCPIGIDHEENIATALRERVLPNNSLLAHEKGFMKSVIGELKGKIANITNRKEVRI